MNYKNRDDELIRKQKEARERTLQNLKKETEAVNKTYSGKALEELAQGNHKVPKLKANQGTTKPSTRYNNQNVTRGTKSTRDTSFDKDFDNFYNYREGDFSGEVDYDPTTDTDVEKWRNVKKDIMAKNKWSDKEFEDRYKEYSNERYKKQATADAQLSADFATKHPVLGTVMQAAENPGVWIEGAANMVSSLLPERFKAQSSDDPRFYSTMQKTAMKQAVKDNNIKTDLGKTAYDVGTSLGDMILSTGIPVLGAATLGTETASRSQMQALERGVDPNKAAITGGVAGVVSGVMNKVGLDKALGSTGKTAIGTVLKAAGKEGAENVLEDLTNLDVDLLLNADKSQFGALHDYYVSQGMDEDAAWRQVARDTAGDLAKSFGSGAAFGGFMSGIGKVPALTAEIGGKLKGLDNRGMLDVDAVGGKNPDIQAILNREPNIQNAKAQAENAKAEIERLQEQIPATTNVMPKTGKVSNPKLAIKPLEGAELESARTELAEIDKAITTYKDMIEVQKGIYENATKRYKNEANKRKNPEYKKLKGYEDELARLESNKKEINNRINGKAPKMKDVIKKNNPDLYYSIYGRNTGVMDRINYVVKYAGDTPEAKQLGKDIKQAYEDFVETGDVNYISSVDRKISQLDNLAMTVNNEYLGYRFADNFDSFDDNGNPENTPSLANVLFPNIDEVNKYHKSYFGNDVTNMPEAPTDGQLTPEEVANLQEGIRELESEGADEPNVPKVQPTETPTQEVPRVDERRSFFPEQTNPTVDEGNYGESRVVTNSAINADVITKDMYDNDPVLQNIAKYEKHSNKKTFESAMNNVRERGSELLDEYITDKRGITTDEDVDTAMILLRDLSQQLKDGADVTAQRNLLLSRLRKAGTERGQFIQAFAKWNDTAEGAIINGQRILQKPTDEWISNNQRQAKKNKDVCNKLMRALAKDDGSISGQTKEPPTYDELITQVMNTLSREMSSVDDFDYTDYRYLAGLIQDGATVDELADAMNTKFATGTFGIEPETQAKVADLFDYADQFDPDSKNAIEAKSAAYKLIADEVVQNASPMEKFDAWRYLAMLGNPKTMTRNFIGNKIFGAVTGVSNNLSALLEEGTDRLAKRLGADGIQRTKAILNPVDDRGLIQAAANDGDAHRYSELEGTKYERGTEDAIRKQKSVFNSKLLKLYEKATNAGISDYRAVKKKYSTSLSGYMKANGLDETAFDADDSYRELKDISKKRSLTDDEFARMQDFKEVHEQLEKARDYAVKQAEYATFHEDNAFAKWLTKASQSAPGPGRALIEGLVPFKKTPANILRSGFEYSPFGALKSIKETGKLIYENTGNRKYDLADTYTKTSKLTGKTKEVNRSIAADVLDSWSKTLTGSALVGLGYYLKNKGILNSSNKDEKWQDDLEGIQNYSITINGKTYTLDWAAPAVMPLLMGAEMSKIKDMNGLLDKKWYENLGEAIGTANSILDPIFETSMMQGVKNTLEQAANDIKYNEDNAVGGIIGSMALNTGLGYVSQALPTLSGQIARTIDNTRRTSDTASDGALGVLEKQGRKLMNKIPGLSMLNQPYFDSYGRTQSNSPFNNPLGNLAYQMMSPAYIRDINTTAPDEQARNAYYGENEEGKPIMDSKVFPAWKSTVKVNGEKLAPEDMATYRKESGQANYDIRDALTKEEWFNQLDPSKQTEVLKKVNTVVDKIGKEATGHEQTGKDIEAYNEGKIPSLIDYFHEGQSKKSTTDLGVSVNSNAGKEITKLYNEGKVEEAEQKAAEYTDKKEKLNAINEKYGTNMAMSTFEKYGEEGAEQRGQSSQNAIKYGFVDKNGKAKPDAYDKAVEVVGNNDNALRAYSSLQQKGYTKNAQLIPELMNNRTFTDQQKGKIIMAQHNYEYNDLGATAKGAYDREGEAGLYYFYLLKNLADTKYGDGNGSVKKAEKIALMNSDNPYVTALSDDLYYYLGDAKW